MKAKITLICLLAGLALSACESTTAHMAIVDTHEHQDSRAFEPKQPVSAPEAAPKPQPAPAPKPQPAPEPTLEPQPTPEAAPRPQPAPVAAPKSQPERGLQVITTANGDRVLVDQKTQPMGLLEHKKSPNGENELVEFSR